MPETDTPPTAGPIPEGPPPARFQLVRSRENRRLGGVAGGLAVAADLDPTLVRLAVFLAALTGWGLLAYVIAWVVIPAEDPAAGRPLQPAPERIARGLRLGLAVAAALGGLHVVGVILGLVFSAIGGLLFIPAKILGFEHFYYGVDMPGRGLLGLLLLVGGGFFLYRRRTGAAGDAPVGPAGPGSPGRAAPGPGGPTAPAGAGLVPAFPSPPGGTGTPPPPPPRVPGSPSGASPAAPSVRPAGRWGAENLFLLLTRAAGWLVVLWFLAAGLVVTALWAAGALRITWPIVPAAAGVAAVVALGTALLRSRRVGVMAAAGAGLLVPVLLLLGLTRLDGPAGYRSVAPTSAEALERSYRHAVGSFVLDLSDLRLPAGRTSVKIALGAGRAVVTVPWDARVEASVSVGAGEFRVFGREQSGLNLRGEGRSAGQPEAPTLVLTARTGVGQISVHRAPPPGAASDRSAGSTFTCTIPPGGGPADCRPQPPEPLAPPEPPAATEPPAVPEPPVPPAPPAVSGEEYRCVIPTEGGPAVCKPLKGTEGKLDGSF